MVEDWYREGDIEDKLEWAEEWHPSHCDVNWLARDAESEVREAIAANESVPIPILEKLAKDEVWRVRRAVSRNPNTPKAIVDKLEQELKKLAEGQSK